MRSRLLQRIGLSALLALPAVSLPVWPAGPRGAADGVALAAEGGDALARRRFKEAQAHFAAGRFAEAAQAYEAAYAARALPAFLFNAAQAYRNLGNLPRAVTFYRSYLTDSPQAANRQAVLRTIAELERKIAEEKSAVPDMPIPVVPPPTPPGPPGPPAPPPAPPTPPAPEAAPAPAPRSVLPSPVTSPDLQAGGTPPDQPARAPLYKRWWFWTIIGVAVAGGATAAGVLGSRGGGSITQSTLGEFRVMPPGR